MTMNLDEFLQSGIDHARSILIGKPGAELMPAFVVQFKDRPPAIIGAPWADDSEKYATIEAVRLTLKAFRPSVISYLFWSEAWMAHEDTDHPIGLQPRDRMDRQEVVLVNAFNLDGGKMVTLEIMRDDKGVVTELKSLGATYEQFEGRLHNLLKDD